MFNNSTTVRVNTSPRSFNYQRIMTTVLLAAGIFLTGCANNPPRLAPITPFEQCYKELRWHGVLRGSRVVFPAKKHAGHGGWAEYASVRQMRDTLKHWNIRNSDCLS